MANTRSFKEGTTLTSCSVGTGKHQIGYEHHGTGGHSIVSLFCLQQYNMATMQSFRVGTTLRGIAPSYGLNDRGECVPTGAGNFSFRCLVQTESGVHLSSYPLDNGVKSTGAGS